MTFLVLILAGLGAGALNAVAGGGSFLSFPALVWAGVPPLMANATATFAALPGYVGSAWAFRHDLATDGKPPLRHLLAASVIGGLIGAVLLLLTPARLFSGVVPWLLLFATAAFAAGPVLLRRLMASGRQVSEPAALAMVLAVSIYGGYFNGGLGILLLASFGLIGMTDLHRMNGLKNLMSVVLAVVSVVTYALAGLIDWGALAVVGSACAVGGYLGARASKRIRNMTALRLFIIATGLAMSAAFFAR